jgi:hypothetical protein
MAADIPEHSDLRRGGKDFKTFLRSGPDVELEIDRPSTPARVVDLARVVLICV